jgi:phenylpropionate dioxygenase-like ring-hydroxylating dioxygenase large terminal subunit
LTQVHTEVFAGFVFVNLDPEARPMASWYPDAEEQLRAYVPDIEALCPVAWLPVEEDCNWKVSVENYSECYHCGINHPTFAKGVVDPKRYDIRPQGYCLRHQTRAVNLEAMTYPVDPTANAHALDYSSWFLWPGFSFQVYPGNLLNTYHWQPTGAETVTVHRGWYTADGVDSEVVSRLARQDLDTTVAEDLRLVNSVQRGLHSRGYRPGPLLIDPDFGVNSEHSLSALKDWLMEALNA